MKLILACIFVTVLRRVYSIQYEWTVEHVEGPINQDADPDWLRGPPKDVKDFAPDDGKRSLQISKALLDSWKAIKLITRGAKHVYSDGKVAVYRKKGSYTKALEDFYTTNPDNVRDLISFSYVREASGDIAQLHKMGVIGRRRIYIGTEKSGGAPVIAVSRVFHPETLDRVIIYRD